MGVTFNISNSEKISSQNVDNKISEVKKILYGILCIGILFIFLIIILIIILFKKKNNNNDENADKINTNNLEGNKNLSITFEDLYKEIRLLKEEIEEIKKKTEIFESKKDQQDNLYNKIAIIEKKLNSITPIYRLYGDIGDHFYCSTEDERDRARRIGYMYECIEFYAFPKDYS